MLVRRSIASARSGWSRRRKTLWRGEDRINLSARLFNTLLYLVVHHGRVVLRGELEEAVWPSRMIEDNNLPQAIYALRKALQLEGAPGSLIVTAPGRGYRFGMPVYVETAPSDRVGIIQVTECACGEPAGCRSARTQPGIVASGNDFLRLADRVGRLPDCTSRS